MVGGFLSNFLSNYAVRLLKYRFKRIPDWQSLSYNALYFFFFLLNVYRPFREVSFLLGGVPLEIFQVL